MRAGPSTPSTDAACAFATGESATSLMHATHINEPLILVALSTHSYSFESIGEHQISSRR